MRLNIATNTVPHIVEFSVTPKFPQRIRIFACDSEKPLTLYTDRFVNIKNERKFELRLPVTPKNLSVCITDANGGDKLAVQVSEAKVKKTKACSAFMDSQASAFIRFAQKFNEDASYLPVGIYKSTDNRFLIKYVPTIVDQKTGKKLNTPARIGHTTGNIEVAQDKWVTYSVPMRMCILLHEFSHKYLNPKLGRPINDEVAADINALYMYLGMGYPAIDARLVFAYVFYNYPSELNKKRMNILDDYINRFQRGEVIKGCS